MEPTNSHVATSDSMNFTKRLEEKFKDIRFLKGAPLRDMRIVFVLIVFGVFAAFFSWVLVDSVMPNHINGDHKSAAAARSDSRVTNASISDAGLSALKQSNVNMSSDIGIMLQVESAANYVVELIEALIFPFKDVYRALTEKDDSDQRR